jgi:hypothetical protein
VAERESYFDPTPLLWVILTRPRAWPALAAPGGNSGPTEPAQPINRTHL